MKKIYLLLVLGSIRMASQPPPPPVEQMIPLAFNPSAYNAKPVDVKHLAEQLKSARGNQKKAAEIVKQVATEPIRRVKTIKKRKS
jgi:hypothetical protein